MEIGKKTKEKIGYIFYAIPPMLREKDGMLRQNPPED